MSNVREIRVTPEEWRLLAAIREIPDGPLRDAFEDVLEHLADLITNPSCAEMQADGVPCGGLRLDCEQCLRLEELLETMRRAMPVR